MKLVTETILEWRAGNISDQAALCIINSILFPEEVVCGRKREYTGNLRKTPAQRKAEWRAKNPDHCRSKNREYVRAYRKRQKVKKQPQVWGYILILVQQ